MEFLRSFLRRHLAGKPVVASPNVSCFLRLEIKQYDKVAVFHSTIEMTQRWVWIQMSQLEKAADISRHHRWKPGEMTSAQKRAQKFRTDDASLRRSEWCFWLSKAAWPIRKTTNISVVTFHNYGIFCVSQTSFRGETCGGVVKCWLFSQAIASSKIWICSGEYERQIWRLISN